MPIPDPAVEKICHGEWVIYGTKYRREYQQVLKNKHYAKILHNPSFRGLQEVSKKFKTLKEKGMGSGQRTVSALTAEEVESFRKTGVFTPAPPLGLLKILFFYMSMNFGMHSGHCYVVL